MSYMKIATPFGSECIRPMSSACTRWNKRYQQLHSNFSEPKAPRSTLMAKVPFHSTWSISFCDSLGPQARSGHFTCLDEENAVAYIGYGLSDSGEYLSDVWAYYMNTNEWHHLELVGDIVEPRSSTRAVLYRGNILVFGGFANGKYYNNLHTINISTGCVSLVISHGEPPSARSTPLLTVYEDKLFVWGGYDRGWPTDLSVLDLWNLEWNHYSQDVTGRTSVSGVQQGSKFYSWGGSKAGGLLCIDCIENKVSIIPTRGTEPPKELMGAASVKIGKYMVVFGGKQESNYSLMYALDCERMWWLILHSSPDYNTTEMCDGYVNDNGIFFLPTVDNFSFIYHRSTNQLVSFFGYPEKNPVQINRYDLSTTMPVLNLMDDMLICFNQTRD